MLNIGEVIGNKDIAEIFKCSNQGGIRRSKTTKSVVLIAKFIPCSYQHWKDGEILNFVGMGKRGDQELKRGNKVLAEAKQNGDRIHLFEMYEEGEYTYKGEVEIAGELKSAVQADDDGVDRSVIVFPLKVIG